MNCLRNFHVEILSSIEAILCRCALKGLFPVNSSKSISERAHFEHSYKPATILKMFCVRDVYPGTWSKFPKQETLFDVCEAKGIEVLTQCCSLTIYKEWNRYYTKIYRGCLCGNWKPNFLSRLIFNWRTFSRRVTARWYHQWAKNQVSTKQNSENRWCQIVRWAIWT